MSEYAQWMLDLLDDRERREIVFAHRYAAEFHHGTDGHGRLMLLSKLAAMLDKLEAHEVDVVQLSKAEAPA